MTEPEYMRSPYCPAFEGSHVFHGITEKWEQGESPLLEINECPNCKATIYRLFHAEASEGFSLRLIIQEEEEPWA